MAFKEYHIAWLSAHPGRSEDWLRCRLADGFHIHHVDGDHENNAPENLVLIEGADHMRLHGMDLRDGIGTWRRKKKPRKNGLVEYERVITLRAGGMTLREACREVGISRQSYYRYRRQWCGAIGLS